MNRNSFLRAGEIMKNLSDLNSSKTIFENADGKLYEREYLVKSFMRFADTKGAEGFMQISAQNTYNEICARIEALEKEFENL